MPTKPNFPAYRIQTARLVLRCWNPEDAPLLKAAIDESLEHLRPWMPWAHSEPEELSEKVKRLRHFRALFDRDEDYIYGVFDLEESRVLGGTGLHTRLGEGALEIGYWIHADFTNQGLTTELAGALTRVAFEVNGVNRVEIHCAPDNLASAAVPRKLGYLHEATLRQRVQDEKEEWGDSMIWTLFADDYPGSAAAQTQLQAFDASGQRIL